MKETLRANPGIRNTVLDLPDPALLAQVGVAGDNAEGLFFPDTYFFARHSADVALLTRASRCSTRGSQPHGIDARAELPLRDAVRGADPGIDRREGDRATRRPPARGVGVRQPVARRACALQTDPTVIYGLGGASTATCASATSRPTRRTTPTRAMACRRRRSRCRRRPRSTPRCIRRRRGTSTSCRAATAARPFRRRSPSTTGSRAIPAGRAVRNRRCRTRTLHHARGHRRRGQEHARRIDRRARSRARRARRRDARARRHAAGRGAARAAAAAADEPRERGAADVRRAARARAAGHPPGARARRLGALRPLHRRDVRLPGRRARRVARRSTRSRAGCTPIASPTSRCCSTCRRRCRARA